MFPDRPADYHVCYVPSRDPGYHEETEEYVAEIRKSKIFGTFSELGEMLD